jgi:DNA-binding CsgD family transcriptional regulator
MRIPRHRFTLRERANRILDRIINARDKGLSIKQIARLERISTSRVYYYLRLIRRRRGVRIRRLGKKFYYVHVKPTEVEARRIRRPPGKADVELRGYLNYNSSDHESRDIDIDCVIIVPHDRRAILTGSEQIKQIVKRRLGVKLASMLKFGVSETNPSSANHFLFRRHEDNWIELQ